MLSNAFIQHLQTVLSQKLSKHLLVKSIEKAYGGSVNQSYILKSNEESYFIKVNNAWKFPDLFETEALGLNLLNNTKTFKIPQIVDVGVFENNCFLILEYIEQGQSIGNFWFNFAKSLTELHKNSSTYFGLDYSNYNGSLNQINDKKDNWADFFIENRLQYQCKLAFDNKKVEITFVKYFEKIYKKIDQLFPMEKPSLIHGDFWSGNYLISNKNEAIIIDPAVYYGHREMDIAMSLLFGGFDKKLYQHYNEIFPLEKGWEKRVDVANLYPLMVHVNLFGESYLKRVKGVLKKFI